MAFQSTLPARGATLFSIVFVGISAFQSTLPARGATVLRARLRLQPCNFNPRSPHGERREQALQGRKPSPFQSTLPARGATTTVDVNGDTTKLFQSTLPARGATRITLSYQSEKRFQSTLPARGATRASAATTTDRDNFNPRSPHGERHKSNRYQPPADAHFNPRSPHGERRASCLEQFDFEEFQSTLPARGATSTFPQETGTSQFQSTLPARGATVSPQKSTRTTNFNPRSPHGERQGKGASPQPSPHISIHAPRTGSDAHARCPCSRQRAFQSTLPARGATTLTERIGALAQLFQSTLPARGATGLRKSQRRDITNVY